MVNTGNRTAATAAITVGKRLGEWDSSGRQADAAREVCQNSPSDPIGMGRPMLGQFLEFSFSARPLAGAFEFYRALGFQTIPVGDQLTEPYVALFDGNVAVGLHDREQAGPLLTFVRPQLREYARAIRRVGVELEREHL